MTEAVSDRASTQRTPSRPSRRVWHVGHAWRAWLAGVVGLLLLLGLLLAFFPWDLLRGPVSRLMSERLSRTVDITRHLDVRLGRRLVIRAEGLTVANPSWARSAQLLSADLAEVELRWWPLLKGRVELPRLRLEGPVLALEQHPDGRRTWAFGQSGQGEPPVIGELQIDRGQVSYLDPAQGMDVQASFALQAGDSVPLPLSFTAKGRYRGLPFAAQGRSGGVLELHENRRGPFPIDLQASAGQTRLKAAGSVSELASLGALDLNLEMQGPSLRELDRLVDAVLPATRAYRLKGRLRKEGEVWRLSGLEGVLGRSDLAGDVVFDRSGKKPLLQGNLQSRRLDFEDLGPLIGASPAEPAGRAVKRQPSRQQGRVLPAAPLDLGRLARMNADLSFRADEVRNTKGLPLERFRTRIQLDQGALRLDPLILGVAGGEMTGRLTTSGQGKAARVAVRLDARALQLNRLFPTIEQTRSSLGKVSGSFDLQGQGQSVAEWLGSASGEWGLLMGRGQISNILLEFMGLDGAEIVKFLVRGDQDIRLRCSALGFSVVQGVMTSRVILLDTVDTVVRGQGRINLANETLDLVLTPEPKDSSILSMRSPLRIRGTLATPEVGPDKAALAGRAGLAIALGVINPLLALAATVETGPGQDADCALALETVRKSVAAGDKVAAPAPPEAGPRSAKAR